PGDGALVDAAGHFIHEDKPRAHGEPAREFEPLALSGGEFAREVIALSAYRPTPPLPRRAPNVRGADETGQDSPASRRTSAATRLRPAPSSSPRCPRDRMGHRPSWRWRRAASPS